LKNRAAVVLVQLFVCACALPEVENSQPPSDAGAVSSAREHDARAADPAAVPAPDDESAKLPASDAGAQPAMPPASASVTPSVPTCRIEPALRDETQTIWMVVDGSGSMVELLGDKSRWVALREALLDNTAGVVRALDQVHWGLALYDGPVPGGVAILPDGGVLMTSVPPATTCPRLITVDPKPANFAALNAIYPLDPLGGSTPTHMALMSLSAKIIGAHRSDTDHKTTVVLATDGAPNDFCATGTGTEVVDRRPDVIAEVQKLAQAGIKTYVISLAGGDHVLSEHLEQVAQAGRPGQPAFIPASRTELIDTLREIATVNPTCDVALARALDPLRACDAAVQVAGKSLTCNAADGFSLRDENHLRLTGSACAEYQASPNALEVSYPCDAVR